MRNESASIVMIAVANCDWNEVRQLSQEPCNFTRLLDPCFGPEHVVHIVKYVVTGDDGTFGNDALRPKCTVVHERTMVHPPGIRHLPVLQGSMVTKEEFENRQEQVKEQIHWFALEFGSIFVLDTLKEHILESIEQAKIDAKEDVVDGYEKEEDTSTVEFLQAYADELDGIITRLHAIEEKYNPGGKALAAKTDALFEKYAELMAEVDAA